MTRRFDTMLATVLAQPLRDDAARIAAWRQIVDIIAQANGALASETRSGAVAQLIIDRSSIALAERRMAAASLAGRTSDADLAIVFGCDVPAVAAPFLSRLVLADRDWEAVIAALPATSRNLLRNRRDLPNSASDLLARFASGDLALPARDVPQPGVSQIRDLVERIAAYRERVPAPRAEAPLQIDAAPAMQFQFETTTDGTIDWVEGCAREAIVGLSVAETADAAAAGVVGQATGAWRRRAPFNEARLLVGGTGAAGGDWLISAMPLFNPRDGRFCGYRGTARRPRPDEQAGGGAVVAMSPDGLRQLVHELRTPLNAIQGFAEMIERQMLGPAADRYRARARAIVGETERLVAMVDDLDTTARLDGSRGLDGLEEGVGAGPELGALVATVVDRQQSAVATRGGAVTVSGFGGAALTISTVLAERMIARLLAACVGVAGQGENISVTLAEHANRATCAVSRPAVLAGREDSALLDPVFDPDGDWPEAPLLGLGFTLRLVARLAEQVGGSLTLRTDRFELSLPAAPDLASTAARP